MLIQSADTFSSQPCAEPHCTSSVLLQPEQTQTRDGDVSLRLFGTFIGSTGGWCFQTTFKPHPVPWLEGCQATSGAHSSWRHTAQGDGVLWGRWGEMGVVSLAEVSQWSCLRSLTRSSSHSWGAVTRLTHLGCHMPVKAMFCTDWKLSWLFF